MNYKLHYQKLIDRSQSLNRNKIDDYYESHHVVPKCLGGLDHKDNLVLLTPEEHYVAHQLLAKIYPDNKGLVWACLIMCGSTNQVKRNNKAYGWIKKQHAKLQSITMIGNTNGAGNKGKKHSIDTKLIIKEKRATQIMQPRSQETKDRIAAGIRAGWENRKTINKLGRKPNAEK